MNHKRFTHWTPRYIYNRISVMIYEKKYPELPWLTKESNHFIKNYIKSLSFCLLLITLIFVLLINISKGLGLRL